MLTQKEKNVLDYLISLDSPDGISIEDSESIDGASGIQLGRILEDLCQNGYIKLRKYINGERNIMLTHKGASYKEIEEQSIERNQPAQVFNIQEVHNSAFGNTGTVNINNSISKLRDQIDSSDSQDKEALQKMTDILQKLLNDEIPPKKGLLSKFSEVIERNDWFKPQVAATLLSWLLSR